MVGDRNTRAARVPRPLKPESFCAFAGSGNPFQKRSVQTKFWGMSRTKIKFLRRQVKI